MMEILNLLSRLQNLILIQATQLLRENALDMSKIVSVHIFACTTKGNCVGKKLSDGKEIGHEKDRLTEITMEWLFKFSKI